MRLAAAAVAAATLFASVPGTAGMTGAAETVYGAVSEDTGSPFTDLTYTHDSKFEGYELFNGIDVSKWNNLDCTDGEIDWAACKEAGVDFVFVRVGYRKVDTGELLEDPYYKQNIEGALANGISVGVYIFSEALTTAEAKEEAKFLVKRVKNYDVTLPLVIDYEGGSYTSGGKSYPGRVAQAYKDGTLTKESATKVIRAFCKYVQSAGYTPMIYANSNYLQNYMDGEALGEDYQIWYARYAQDTASTGESTYYQGNYDYWQYSESGYVGAMKVDCNFLYKNFNVTTKAPAVTGQLSDSIILEWEATSDALGYYVYRLNPDTGKYVKIGTTRECTFVDEGLDAVTEYSYKLRAYWTIGGTTYTAKASKAVTGSTSTKAVTKLTASARTGDSITLSWKAVSKAKGYTIYQYDSGLDEYQEIASVSGKSSTTYTVTDLSGSKEYRFIVCAYTKYNGEKLMGEDSDELVTRTNPVKVKKVVAYETASDSVTIKFTKQSRVSGYYVYRYSKATGKWSKIGTSTNGYFTDEDVAANTQYTYRVRAYKKSGSTVYYGKYSPELTVKTAKASKKS
jgi:fibronectin type 3 domain-containing protein